MAIRPDWPLVVIPDAIVPDPPRLVERLATHGVTRIVLPPFGKLTANTPPLVALSVRDAGPGIPPETLPKIFQPYFTTKGPQQGTGLGLNIVQRLIKEAKGALHVHTEVGHGTTFTIYLAAAH